MRALVMMPNCTKPPRTAKKSSGCLLAEQVTISPLLASGTSERVQQSREQKLGTELQLPASAWWNPDHAKPLQPTRDGARFAEEAPKYWSPLFQAPKRPTAPHQLLAAMQDPWGTSPKIPQPAQQQQQQMKFLLCFILEWWWWWRF